MIDTQTVLTDFDTDDRGLVYVATQNFGWGIVSDPGGADGSHLPSVTQVVDNETIDALVSIKSNGSYYLYTSTNASSSTTLYGVTNPAVDFGVFPNGNTHAFRAWSKYDAGERVALINLDGHVRVYSYPDLVSGAAPLIEVTPNPNRIFSDLSFDDDGKLWIAERAIGSLIPPNHLWELSPSGNSYTTTQHYGTTATRSRLSRFTRPPATSPSEVKA